MKIEKKYVYFGLDSVSKEDAIKMSGQRLFENGFIREEYIDSMLEKEKTDITYIGNGIAIPHGLNQAKKYVNKSGIVILHFPKGVQYDDNIAYMIIGIAGSDDDHLNILQDIAVKFSDQKIVDKLVASESKDSFVKLLNETSYE
ncbi:PTS sugar transporter subunit IIA [Bacillaceae bacterium Marseille-Q3522]|nr:PTS sugar transporter subunit IIA [Bacillaceae bacterium Marseille-Q3522]